MSNYSGFHVNFQTTAGLTQTVPAGVQVKVRNSVTNTDITTLTTDANGYIPSGTLSVPVGTLVYFRVENYMGLSANKAEVTT